MTSDDLAEVADIAELAFPDHHEEPACFAQRLALAPSWCFALDDGTGKLSGYLVAYPWPLGTIPPLNAVPKCLPDQRETLFLHDLAVRPAAAGSGQAGAIVEELATRAQDARIAAIALVAVNGTERFWRRHGFMVGDEGPAMRNKLATYGEGALYMRRSLAPERVPDR